MHIFGHSLILICLVELATLDAPEVKIDQGSLRGYYRKSWKGRNFSAFTGIPYAQPPVGKLRFEAPVPAGPWTGTKDAFDLHPICPQMNLFVKDFTVQGDEDCLYLNVYTPQLPSSNTKLLPVMFFIHGGAWLIGNANSVLYGPDILMDKDVVLVTSNYRLGALGFLSTGDSVVPGNNGLKDQNLALKWTKKNVAYFGGDPDQITIFGQSAGAASVHYHLVSPLSKDLMTGAIMQSGTALAPWALGSNKQTIENFKKLANLLNCPTNSNQETVECLKKVDMRDIIAQEPKFTIWTYDPIIPFRPVIEPNLEGAFLTEDPIDTIKSGKSAQIPIISGFNTEEGTARAAALYSDSTLIPELDEEFLKIAPITLLYEETPADKDAISKKIRQFYFGEGKIDDSTKSEVTNMYTDAWFFSPADYLIRLHWKYNKQPLYYFLFGYRGSVTFGKLYGDPSHNYGVCHGDDLIYLFNSPALLPDYKPNACDQKVTDIMITLWTNFASTGNPTPETNSLIESQWEPVHSEKREYYFLKNPCDIIMRENVYPDRAKLWKSIAFSSRWTKLAEL